MTRINPRVVIISSGICLVLGVALLMTVYAQSNNTVLACYRDNTGALRRVSSLNECTNQEAPISWKVVGPQGPQGLQGPSGPQGDAGPGQLRVFDVNNVEVGRYDARNGVIRYIPSINRWLIFRADKNGFVDTATAFLYHSFDCSGPAQPNSNLGNDFRAFVQFASIAGDSVYYATGPVQPFIYNSQKTSSGQCSSSSGTANVTPHESFSLSSLGNTHLSI